MSSSPTRSLSIAKLHPAETPAGTPFNVQPNGAAALAVSGSGFVKGDAISWNGTTLTTTFGNEGLLSAIVPPELFAKPGDVVIAVKNPADPAAGEARATFKVLRAP